MLQYFSSLMLEMYETAEQAACSDFFARVTDLLARALSFDVAELGCGVVRERRRSPRLVVTADPAVLSSSFQLDLPPPAVCSNAQLRQLFDPSRLLDYAQRQGLRQLLLIGSVDPPQRPPDWLLLGRRGRRPFTTGAALYVTALWPHLLRCKQLCQRRYLAEQASASATGGFAIVSAQDAVDACDAAFSGLARREWPPGQGTQLPTGVLATLHSQGRYEGRLSRWSLEPGQGTLSCARAPNGYRPTC